MGHLPHLILFSTMKSSPTMRMTLGRWQMERTPTTQDNTRARFVSCRPFFPERMCVFLKTGWIYLSSVFIWIRSSGWVIAPCAPLQDCIQKSVDALLREGKFKDLAFTKLHYASLLNDSAALYIIDSFKRLAKYHLVHA